MNWGSAVIAVAVTVTGPPSGGPAPETWRQPAAARYDSTDPVGVTVRMNDGVELVGDVIYPADPGTRRRAGGRFPVLLVQNPYQCDTTSSSLALAKESTAGSDYYADHGYVYAVVCVRGTGRSGGDFDLWGPRQQQDGVALVHWAAHELSGGSGVVGMIGCSYLGLTQLFTAAALPRDSGVRAIVPLCAGAEFHREAAFSGGMPTDTAMTLSAGLGQLMGPRAGAFGTALTQEIAAGGPRAYDDAYSKARTTGNVAERVARTGIPVLLWSGYDDMFALGAQELYAYLQNAYAHRPVHAPMTPGQRTTPRYQAVIGPWGHGDGIDPTITLAWLDTWLKGRRTGMDQTDTPLHLRQQGSGKWVNTATLPVVREATPFYLGAGGTLTTRPRTGVDEIAYAQNAALEYTTTPFRHGTTIAGPLSASLVASSSGTNLQLIGTLSDVAPDGTVTKLAAGSLVGSQRALDRSRTWYDAAGHAIRPYGTFTGDEYLTPGKRYRLEFPMSSRVAEVAPGHALRLTVTTQTPASECGQLLRFAPCYPTVPQQRTLPGTYRVALGVSAVNLPLAPYDCFPASGGTGEEPQSFRGPVHTCD
jgi:predicted acyl esterase